MSKYFGRQLDMKEVRAFLNDLDTQHRGFIEYIDLEKATLFATGDEFSIFKVFVRP